MRGYQYFKENKLHVTLKCQQNRKYNPINTEVAIYFVDEASFITSSMAKYTIIFLL